MTRIYLVQEDAAVARRRKKLGGNRTPFYVEGWIEFADRKVSEAPLRPALPPLPLTWLTSAPPPTPPRPLSNPLEQIAKQVAASLNNTKIGGKKRGFYSEDIWNLKYLRKFTWSHLTEKKAYERRVREHKLRLEMVTARKQNEEFREMVDKNKMIRSMEERKASKKRGIDEAGRGSCCLLRLPELGVQLPPQLLSTAHDCCCCSSSSWFSCSCCCPFRDLAAACCVRSVRGQSRR